MTCSWSTQLKAAFSFVLRFSLFEYDPRVVAGVLQTCQVATHALNFGSCQAMLERFTGASRATFSRNSLGTDISFVAGEQAPVGGLGFKI